MYFSRLSPVQLIICDREVHSKYKEGPFECHNVFTYVDCGASRILEQLAGNVRNRADVRSKFKKFAGVSPFMAHERVSSTLLKVVTFASRSFSTFFAIFSGLHPT